MNRSHPALPPKVYARLGLLLGVLMALMASRPLPASAGEPSAARGLPSARTLRSLGRSEWYGVYAFGAKAGWANIKATEKAGSWTYSMRMRLEIKAFGTAQSIQVEEQRTYDTVTGRLRRLRTRFDHPTQKVESRLEVRGARATLTQTLAGRTTRKEIDAPEETLRDVLAPALLVIEGGMTPGNRSTSVTFEALPPFSRSLRSEHRVLRVEERVVDGVAVRVAVVQTKMPEQGMKLTSLVLADGTGLEVEMMGMLKLRLEPENVARSALTTPDLLALSLVRTDVPLRDTGALRELSLRIRLPDEPPTFSDGHVEVLRRKPGYAEIRLRRGSLSGPPGKAKADPKDLAATDLIQSDHPKIRARAREVVAGTRDRAEQVRKLVRYVYGAVRKEYRAALSNALDVLEDPVGDCTEHAVYFVALARAAGIPSRLLVGLAYTQEAGGGFGGHAWAEVLLRGRWVAVDPTFGQVTADAAHIPLGVGDLDDIGHLAGLLGQIKVKVLGTRRESAEKP